MTTITINIEHIGDVECWGFPRWKDNSMELVKTPEAVCDEFFHDTEGVRKRVEIAKGRGEILDMLCRKFEEENDFYNPNDDDTNDD